MCSDIVVTNNVKIPGRDRSPKNTKGNAMHQGTRSKEEEFLRSKSLCYWQSLITIVRNRVLAASLSCLGLQGWPASPCHGKGCRRKQLDFLPTEAVEPVSPGGLPAQLSQTPSSDLGCWQLPLRSRWSPTCRTSAAARQGSDCLVLLPKKSLAIKRDCTDLWLSHWRTLRGAEPGPPDLTLRTALGELGLPPA